MLSLILLVALVIRLVCYTGAVRFDTHRFAEIAHDVLRGKYQNLDGFMGGYRLSLVVPTMILFWLFGPSDLATAVTPLVCSLLTVVFTFLLARRLFGPQVALLAALLVAFFPLEVALSTQLIPDALVSLFFVLAFYLFRCGEEVAWHMAENWLLAASGLAVVASWYAREHSFLIVIILAGYLFWTERPKWRNLVEYLPYVYGLVGGWLASLVVLLALFGDPFAQVKTLFGVGQSYSLPRLHKGYWTLFGEQPLLLTSTLLGNKNFWPIVPPAFAALVAAFARARRYAAKLLLLWMVVPYLFVEFASPLLGFPKIPRYVMLLSVPSCMLVAWACVALVKWASQPGKTLLVKVATRIFAVASVLYIIGLICWFSFTALTMACQFNNVFYPIRAPAQALARLPRKPILFSRWDHRMNLFLQYRSPCRFTLRVLADSDPRKAKMVSFLEENVIEEAVKRRLPRKMLSILSAEDCYVLWDPNLSAEYGFDGLIPSNWRLVHKFERTHNWRKTERWIFEARGEPILRDPSAAVATARRLAQQGRLRPAIRILQAAGFCAEDPTEVLRLEEAIRLRLWARGESVPELDVALPMAGARVKRSENFSPPPLDASRALLFDRRNCLKPWQPAKIAHIFEPASLVLDLGCDRTVHFVEVWLEKAANVRLTVRSAQEGSARLVPLQGQWEQKGGTSDNPRLRFTLLAPQQVRLLELSISPDVTGVWAVRFLGVDFAPEKILPDRAPPPRRRSLVAKVLERFSGCLELPHQGQ